MASVTHNFIQRNEAKSSWYFSGDKLVATANLITCATSTARYVTAFRFYLSVNTSRALKNDFEP